MDRLVLVVARHTRGLVFAAVLAAASLAGCGGNGDGGGGVRFEGNVVDVIVPDGSQARRPRPGALERLVSLLLPAATAQQECDPDAADVIACAVTGSGEDCEEPAFQCSRVDASTCEFSAEVRVSCVEFAGVIFVLDEDGDGRPDENEKDASLTFSCSSEAPEECIVRMCNGDVIRARDVAIEFFAEPVEEEDGVANAEEIEKTRDACPEPTGTPTATPIVPA